MLLDAQNEMSVAQAITALGSTVSTNVIDLGAARDIGGPSKDLELLVQVVTAFTSGGSATLQAQFQTSPDNATWSTVVQSDLIPVASLVQGFKFLVNEVPQTAGARYTRLNYVVGTAVMTAGNITAAFVPALDVQPSYPRGYTA